MPHSVYRDFVKKGVIHNNVTEEMDNEIEENVLENLIYYFKLESASLASCPSLFKGLLSELSNCWRVGDAKIASISGYKIQIPKVRGKCNSQIQPLYFQ
jgi:hypothetical protein